MRRVLTGALVIAALAVLVVVGVAVFGGDDDTPPVTQAESNDDGLSVGEAINRTPDVAFAVRGYVFDDGAFVQLCQGIVHDKPPKCRGPSVLLRNLDLARVNLEESRGVRYTAEPVLLGGRIDGTQLFVVDVLSSTE
jgi:hypothetical protein